MSSGFVKTSILAPSENGVTHADVETEVENEAVKEQRAREAQMSAKPIFEQLQANADKKQEEYDAVTKALQAAACPQALDEDDVNHFESLEQRKAAQKQMIADQEEDDVAAFTAARLTRNLPRDREEQSSATTTAAPEVQAPKAKAVDVKVQIKKVKRKSEGDGPKKKKKKKKEKKKEAEEE
eukprot:CAMPEP_0182539414 /NCGR_PEP_ID=MMETSP1323-20130603/25337_1 /TAXON_ID=236787 /ORGANISM="Florenciella parvula, Strain RCC1693" /LENGTH=181 /DNA_ID=CAMNT_0024749975 /DNA_START=212 /DNA_END=754 /DNA_ORIENTATION=-